MKRTTKRKKPGRPKGEVRITIMLTKEQSETLDEMARYNCRSRVGQVLWLVQSAARSHRAAY